ncbi:DUF1028 domain-containing protein [Thermaerobacillus caldiproteolyticus]|uniref:DUF1028 domain-containing protein n=1 Tax=Thermaerobacillus caldiproteolyticus TaxID=247480 RepID=UPI00226491D0|nr:DUF1028 domain-containing protein [Anoxybacillus caldiproteolyticus]
MKAGAGMIVIQSYANTSYVAKGLELMASKKCHKKRLSKILLTEESDRERRKAGIVDAKGNTMVFYS